MFVQFDPEWDLEGESILPLIVQINETPIEEGITEFEGKLGWMNFTSSGQYSFRVFPHLSTNTKEKDTYYLKCDTGFLFAVTVEIKNEDINIEHFAWRNNQWELQKSDGKASLTP